MSYIGEEITDAASELGIELIELSNEEFECIRTNIKKIYANRPGLFLWEKLTDRISVNDSDAWQYIDEFIGDKESILFFNEDEERKAFVIESGSDLVAILGKTSYFEFYITNKNASYLLVFNHHDYLIACGEAKNWLKTKIDSMNR